MNSEWLHRQDRDALIVFCAGWGMDVHPFTPLISSKYDVMVCYNYAAAPQQRPDIPALSQHYDNLILVAWSMGVIYAQRHFREVAQFFSERIAVNGTLCPIDDDYGIPEAIFSGTLANMSEDTLDRFYRRMCRSALVHDLFVRNRPQRSLEDVRDELALMLQERVTADEQESIYDRVFVSDQDLIIPTENQLRFWRRSSVHSFGGGHFPFYAWQNWEALIADLSGVDSE